MANRDHHYDREDPHRTGLPTDPYRTLKKTSLAWCAEGAHPKTFTHGLVIPMAVTEADWDVAYKHGVDVTDAPDSTLANCSVQTSVQWFVRASGVFPIWRNESACAWKSVWLPKTEFHADRFQRILFDLGRRWGRSQCRGQGRHRACHERRLVLA